MKKLLMISASVLALSASAALAANESVLQQSGTSLTADVSQDGSNYSNVQQGNGGTPASNSSADIEQVGNNSSFLYQLGINNAHADVKQNGAGGFSHVFQEHGGAGGTVQATVNQFANGASSAVKADIYQGTGGGHTATINQGVSGTPLTNAQAEIDQHGGASNTALIDQTGNLTRARALQIGAGNDSTILQIGPSSNGYVAADPNTAYTWTEQTGIDNTASITQSGAWGAARIRQSGDLNLSTVVQSGYGDGALNQQAGVGNSSLITQSGDFQTATVNQGWTSGIGGHMSTVTQSGAGPNVATVTQN